MMIVIKISADNPYVKDQGLDRAIALTYMENGLRIYLPHDVGHTHEVSKEVEDSFIGASMFGWDAPVADVAHAWVDSLDIAIN
tara:strand:- start:340 stop:588 length:249 start_codon:yes stop_codon:yes gene_type:complete